MEKQRWEDSEKSREEARRSEKRKGQKKEDAGATLKQHGNEGRNGASGQRPVVPNIALGTDKKLAVFFFCPPLSLMKRTAAKARKQRRRLASCFLPLAACHTFLAVKNGTGLGATACRA